jgi:LDH2 family malate/lactate/ureidoglycolate dehydrogenase
MTSPPPQPSSVQVPRDALSKFARALLIAQGASVDHARIVVDHLIEADAMGLKSHGIIRVPQYLADIVSGEIDPQATPCFARFAPGRATVDGGKGFGQIVGQAMADEAVRLAAEAGVSFIAGRHMGHTGRIGAYAELIARRGAVGIVVCSGPRSGHYVSPFGGLAGRLATNPIAFAYPIRNGPPIVADFSTSVAPEGVIRSLMNRGLEAPPGALRDAAGNPTSDPSALYHTPPGALQPLGGAVGYRGTALALLVEVLGALLAKDDTDDPARLGSNLAMLAIASDGSLAERAERMGKYVRSSPPVDPQAPVMLPGERERKEAIRAGEGPITVDRPTWGAMIAAAGDRSEIPALLRS